jgi:hypothetical protein
VSLNASASGTRSGSPVTGNRTPRSPRAASAAAAVTLRSGRSACVAAQRPSSAPASAAASAPATNNQLRNRNVRSSSRSGETSKYVADSSGSGSPTASTGTPSSTVRWCAA